MKGNKFMKRLFKNYISNLGLSCVRAVYFHETIFGDLADDSTDHSYHQGHLEIAVL